MGAKQVGHRFAGMVLVAARRGQEGERGLRALGAQQTSRLVDNRATSTLRNVVSGLRAAIRVPDVIESFFVARIDRQNFVPVQERLGEIARAVALEPFLKQRRDFLEIGIVHRISNAPNRDTAQSLS